ncbi:hypothetical protein CHARACLAT_020470 [Characodon lateralis]|uniref:Uncharacterized protein n=1 Tax=Characodon lateralis TaxID=208331 RepID=A0ABU7EKT3_9TELE|nr:hypothetical protein [Characodon lateralis]
MLVESLLLSAASHPSIHPSIHPVLLLCFTTSSSLVVCRLEGQPPYSDTLTHVDTHLRDVSLPIPPASSYHSPLTALSTHTCYFPPSVFALINFPGPLLVLTFTPPCPPSPLCLCHHCREKRRNMLQSTSEKRKRKQSQRGEDSKIWSVCGAQRCLRPQRARVFFDGISRTAEGRRREKIKGLPVIASRGPTIHLPPPPPSSRPPSPNAQLHPVQPHCPHTFTHLAVERARVWALVTSASVSVRIQPVLPTQQRLAL